jgi:hypothetical protein
VKQCSGYRRRGGAFTFGPVTWEQCPNTGMVMLTVKQEDGETTEPACAKCWQECIDTGVTIVDVKPILPGKEVT